MAAVMPEHRHRRPVSAVVVVPTRDGERTREASTRAIGTDASMDLAPDVPRRDPKGRGRGPGRTRDDVGPPRTPLDGFADALADYCARLDVAAGRAPPP